MADFSVSQRLSRRRFLQGLGCLTGSLVVAPDQLVGGLASIVQPAAKVAVLLPRSTMYPLLGESVPAGLALGVQPENGGGPRAPITLLSEDIGSGCSLTAEHARRALAENVDLVVAVVSSGAVETLRNAFTSTSAPLLVTNIGASVLREDERGTNVFHHSLGHWESNWTMGRWAAEHLGGTALVASSFYDSGYDALYAFQLGFESAGGRILDTRVTHVRSSREDFDNVMQTIASSRPDCVFASYCGAEAVGFVRSYAASRLSERIPLIGSAFLTDEAYLDAQGPAALGIRTCSGWAPELDTALSRRFAATYQAQTGRRPDAFALLGYETGSLIRYAVDAVGGDARRHEALAEALGTAEWTGPRGRLRMDHFTYVSGGPVFLREVCAHNGRLENTVLAEVGASAVRDEHFQIVRTSLKTGWLHPYLSV